MPTIGNEELLAVGGEVPQALQPLLTWWAAVDQPASVRLWLTRQPAARALLRALADGSIALAHEGLDGLEDSKVVRHVRWVLVACGVLASHDEHLERLGRWLAATVAQSATQHRPILHRYGHWHHLRRLRAPTRLGAANRFQAGVIAARRGWL